MEFKRPEQSPYFQSLGMPAIRAAMLDFDKRKKNNPDINAVAIDTAIGNVCLPMHEKMQWRMFNLGHASSPFRAGVVGYTGTAGLEETRRAFFNIIESSGFKTDGLQCIPIDDRAVNNDEVSDEERLSGHITTGGSGAMQTAILGTCKDTDQPLMVLNPVYANYPSICKTLGIPLVGVDRILDDNGRYSLPDMAELEEKIKTHNPAALVIIPYDNPSGQFMTQEQINEIAKLCVRYGVWLISDEAYRELFYEGDQKPASIWGITEEAVPKLDETRLRIGIETVSKVFNACGLRIGALITDRESFDVKAVYHDSIELCPPSIEQWIVGALAELSHEELRAWYKKQREYYKPMMFRDTAKIIELIPGSIVSNPDAALYTVVDLKNATKPGFDMKEFIMWCANYGGVDMDGKITTLLAAPMGGFYILPDGVYNPGKTQMRIAFVRSPEIMAQVPALLAELLKQYEAQR